MLREEAQKVAVIDDGSRAGTLALCKLCASLFLLYSTVQNNKYDRNHRACLLTVAVLQRLSKLRANFVKILSSRI